MFDMFDFEGRGEVSYDELAICISTVIGALSKVKVIHILPYLDGRWGSKNNSGSIATQWENTLFRILQRERVIAGVYFEREGNDTPNVFNAFETIFET